MKFTSIAFFATILAESSAAEQIRGSVERSLKEEICTFMMREDLMELSTLEKGVGHDELNYECERNDGTTLPLIMDKAQQQLLTMMVEDGNVIPGEATFESLGATVTSNGLVVQHGVEINFEKKSERTSRNRRKLVTKSGDTYYLVVRVIDINGLAHPHSTVTMSDNMFGTINDPVNMKSQIYDCSAGALNIVPGYPDSATEAQKVNIDAVTVDLEHPAGFMEANINIDITTASSRYDVRNAIITKVNELLGFTLPGPFDHVVFNIEKCYLDCGWAAYAYINSWNQVYQGNYYLQTGVQVHEYGHNLGMAHSGGLNGQTYTDHTCMMGNPLYSDDVGRMCYNPAKSYYIGWYSEGIVDFDPSVEDQWSGTLMGVGQWKDYNSNERPHPVVVKIETGTSTDYFVGFNRAAGANADNDEADDLVTIIETGNNGESYSQSFLKGYIGTGQAYTFTNWQDSGQDLVIYVENIDITSNPGTAQVTISTDGTQVPTPAPTPLAGCNQDTVLVDLTTDNYPQETSWQVKNSSGDVVFSREGYTDANTAHQYVDCHDACGGEFVISDTYGDGFCCAYGSGSYSVTVNGQPVVVDGGSFGTSETTSIDCATNPTPAPIPTSAPVEPTSAPVEPTSAPVEPTSAPVEPTSAPVEPTSAPVEPTSAPVEPTSAPVEPTSAPVEPTSSPVDEFVPIYSTEFVNDADGFKPLTRWRETGGYENGGTLRIRKKQKVKTWVRNINAYSQLKIEFMFKASNEVEEGNGLKLIIKFNRGKKSTEWKKKFGAENNDNIFSKLDAAPVEPTSAPVEPTSSPVDEFVPIYSTEFVNNADGFKPPTRWRETGGFDNGGALRIWKKQKVKTRVKNINAYSQLKIEFMFKASNEVEEGNGLKVIIKFNGGSKSTEWKKKSGAENNDNTFSNLDQWYVETIIVDKPSNGRKILIEISGLTTNSGKGDYMVDNVYVTGLK
eukprot:CAMPEP_0194194290 /NCGR_PEP_ID=MMETSP0154-20130528/75503_1 /TAXON_ID=1049557 /ORGANISM="Thalassiothrix antarctica, Strain L6-D1" /LENGTH=954 /DNA_ID=CAMNT_0038918707 /DNA_START=30 /DNA_END=2890 /DNA_ORIENTATION=-